MLLSNFVRRPALGGDFSERVQRGPLGLREFLTLNCLISETWRRKRNSLCTLTCQVQPDQLRSLTYRGGGAWSVVKTSLTERPRSFGLFAIDVQEQPGRIRRKLLNTPCSSAAAVAAGRDGPFSVAVWSMARPLELRSSTMVS